MSISKTFWSIRSVWMIFSIMFWNIFVANKTDFSKIVFFYLYHARWPCTFPCPLLISIPVNSVCLSVSLILPWSLFLCILRALNIIFLLNGIESCVGWSLKLVYFYFAFSYWLRTWNIKSICSLPLWHHVLRNSYYFFNILTVWVVYHFKISLWNVTLKFKFYLLLFCGCLFTQFDLSAITTKVLLSVKDWFCSSGFWGVP